MSSRIQRRVRRRASADRERQEARDLRSCRLVDNPEHLAVWTLVWSDPETVRRVRVAHAGYVSPRRSA